WTGCGRINGLFTKEVGVENSVNRIPTKAEIAELPRWAQVAFAARCARRVQPFYKHSFPDATRINIDSIENAISLAEKYAAHFGTPDTTASFVAARKAEAAGEDALVGLSASEIARDISESAANAAKAADRAARLVGPTSSELSWSVIDTARAGITGASWNAVKLANSALHANYLEHTIGMHRDYLLIKELSSLENWTDGTPVPPEVFGPMWAEGEPEGWPEEEGAHEPCCLKMEIASPAGMNESQSTVFNQKMAAFFAELSALHVGMGGTGLKILDQDSFESDLVDQDQLVCDPSSSSGVLV
ncbi:MAG: hypothetical protein KC996_09765, partial [Phycisphaerales bacterium]|nr:hypothetical protein [Phycisphaerales bacterium]